MRSAVAMRSAVVCLLAVALAACRGNPAPMDWGRVQAEGRLVREPPPGCHVSKNVFWGDGVAELTHVEKSAFGRAQPELLATIEGARGNATTFKVDTAGGATELAGNVPLVDETVLWADVTLERVGQVKETGLCGHLPVAVWGPLRTRELPVTVIERNASWLRGSSILGGVALWHTQMEHRDGRWRVRSGTSRVAASEPGWQVVRLVSCRNYPLVRLLDARGRALLAFVDTGAYASIALSGFSEGTYHLHDAAGRLVADVPVRNSARLQTRCLYDEGRLLRGDQDRPGPRAEEVGLLIGMDFLRQHAWRLTFDQGVWAFPPRP
jgi:hypothetical protein